MSIQNGRIFIIDSSQRIPTDGSSDSNFSFLLNIPPTEKFDRVVILNAVIPKSYYLVQSTNNTFQIVEGANTGTVTIPAGNYNAKSWITQIVPLMNAASPGGFTYNISYPNGTTQTDTGKYTFTVTGNGAVQPSFVFPATSTINEQMGFAVGSTNVFVSNSLTSANVIKFQLEDVLLLHSDICDNSISNTGNGSTVTNDVLQEIYSSSTPPYSNVTFTNYCPEYYSKKLNTTGSNVFRFALTNERNIIQNLNGLNSVYTIGVFKSQDMYNMVKDEILVTTMRRHDSEARNI